MIFLLFKPAAIIHSSVTYPADRGCTRISHERHGHFAAGDVASRVGIHISQEDFASLMGDEYITHT